MSTIWIELLQNSVSKSTEVETIWPDVFLKLRVKKRKKRGENSKRSPAFQIMGFRLWANDFYRILRLRILWYMVNTRYHFINYRLQTRNIQIFTNRIPKINAKTQNLECELAIISALQTDHVLNHNDLCAHRFLSTILFMKTNGWNGVSKQLWWWSNHQYNLCLTRLPFT